MRQTAPATSLLAAALAVALCASADADTLPAPPPPPAVSGGPPPPPPPPPPAVEMKVYVAANGQTLGPFGEAGLEAKIASGEVTRQSLVWMEGMRDWQAAATVTQIAPLFVAAPPTPAFDAAGFMPGTWEARGTVTLPDGTPAQTVDSVTYRTDGSYTGHGTMTIDTGYGPFTMNLSSQGTWKAEPKTDTSFILTLKGRTTGTTPTGPPSVESVDTSVLLTVIDRNTVAGQNGQRSYRVGN